jgi:trehalose 6-phosphate phosphatase
MKHALSRRTSDVLAQLASKRALLAFDFDGTLAPIVADRDRAVMRRRTRTLFGAVCELYPCAVISGRARHDVASRPGKIDVKHVVGNHGIEPGTRRTAALHYQREIDRLLAWMVNARKGHVRR